MCSLSRFVTVWSVLEQRVADGRLPGYAAAVRHRGTTEVRTGGCLVRGGRDPVTADSLFRLSSLSKPYAGVLTLALAEDGVLALADPVTRWLPELAGFRVLAAPGGPLTDTVPAAREITVRDLLTNTAGFGALFDGSPLDVATVERGLGAGPFSPQLDPEEYLARLAGLPLAAQPGERWLYHACTDVLSVLLARAAGRPLGTVLTERVTGPLGLRDTGFRARDARRLTAAYLPDGAVLALLDGADGIAARPPVFEGLAAGLVATAGDVLAFLAALADGGGPVLTPGSVAVLTTLSLTGRQRETAGDFLPAGVSWGLQIGVRVDDGLSGGWGWDGGTGTTGWADPARDLVAVLLTTRGYGGPDDDLGAFWRALHRCL
ncbi:serine hydrolase domain-containing protein [Modestobacter roseus]|uniref:serine hydrolase domain-containing protein n=1 Tax=Modestobacter roseus TaxID=1181884 RepID=UPI0034DF9BCE